MKILFFLSLGLILFACPGKKAPTARIPEDILQGRRLIVSGSEILDENFQALKQYETRRTIFFPDGTTIRAHGSHIVRHDSAGRKIWRVDLVNHHDIVLIRGGKALLVFYSEVHAFVGRMVRFDGIRILDVETGRKLNDWRMRKNTREILRLMGQNHFEFKEADWLSTHHDQWPKGSLEEMSHSNSAFEIYATPAEKISPAFAPGNLMVNFHTPMNLLAIFTPDLSKIVWASKTRPEVHDIQLLPNGNLLFFRNHLGPWQRNPDDNEPYSRVEEITADEKPVWSWGLPGRGEFYSYSRGSVRPIGNDLYIASEFEPISRVTIFHRNGKVVWRRKMKRFNLENEGVDQATLEDVSSFLKNNRE